MRILCARPGAILLVQVIEGPERFWILPGGGIEPSETVEEAATRELLEETGVRGAEIVVVEPPTGIRAMQGYALALARSLREELRSPHLDPAIGRWSTVAWHAVTETMPLGGLDPAYWGGLEDIIRGATR